MRFLFASLLLISISVKASVSTDNKKLFRVDLSREIYSQNYLSLPEGAKSIVEPDIMPGGDLIYDKVRICTLALSDRNHNGTFNEIGIDYIIIGSDDSSVYIHPSVQASEIALTTYISANAITFKVEDIDAQGKYVTLSLCDYCSGSKDIRPTLKLFNKLPQISFQSLTGAKIDFTSFEHHGKYIYIEFWATWCHPCVEYIPELGELYTEYQNQVFFISLNYKDNDKDEVARFIKKNNMPWINGFATPIISGELLQNGFPYGILFDENGNVLNIDLHPSELRSTLSALMATKKK